MGDMADTEDGDMSRRAFQVAYDGGAASGHSMDVERPPTEAALFAQKIRSGVQHPALEDWGPARATHQPGI